MISEETKEKETENTSTTIQAFFAKLQKLHL